MKRSQIALDRN